MRVNIWIANRFKLTGKGSGSSKAGVAIAVCGVAIAVMIMEFTLCIVLGFKHQIRDKLTGFESQITIGPRYLDNAGTVDDTICITEVWRQLIRQSAPGSHASLALRQPAMLKTPDNFSAIILTAHDSVHNFDFERSMIVDGCWPDYTADSTANDIVISANTASELRLKPGDKVDVTYFIDDNIKARRYRIAGIYRSNISAYDGTVGFASMRALQQVTRLDSCTGSAIDITGLPLDSVQAVSQRISAAILDNYYNGDSPYIYSVDTVLHKGSMYFSWLSLLDTNVVVIFILMLSVAGFTLVSSLFILVLEHIPAIGLLRTLGASRRRVRSIFRNMAMRLALGGMLAGNALGLGLMYLQLRYKFVSLDPEMYYLDHVPVEFSVWGLLLLNIGVAAAIWLILIIPSVAAARTDPARCMRYE